MDNLKKYLPVATIVLLVLGYLNLYMYYSLFDIKIYNYVTVGELILSFSPVIIPIGTLAFAYFVISELGIKYMPRRSDGKLEAERPVYRLAGIILYALIILSISQTIYKCIRTPEDGNLHTYLMFSFMFLLIFILIFLRKPQEVSQWRQNLSYSWLIALVAFLIIRNSFEYRKIITGQSTCNVQLWSVAGNNIQSSTAKIAYIGSTTKYHFFRNINEGKNIIVNNSTVDRITKRIESN